MDRKTTAIVATIAAVVLCGCPGMFGLFFGGLFAVISQVPGAEIDMFGKQDPQSALVFGLAAIGISLLFILVPIVVGIIFLRKRNQA